MTYFIKKLHQPILIDQYDLLKREKEKKKSKEIKKLADTLMKKKLAEERKEMEILRKRQNES